MSVHFEGFPGRRPGDTPPMPSYDRDALSPTSNQPQGVVVE